MCGADAGNDIQGLSVRCPSQVEEIVPTLDDDLLYGFALSRTAEECHPTVRDLRAGECVLGLSPDRERRLLITGERRNGRKTGKSRIRTLAPAWQNTYYLEDTGLFRVSLGLNASQLTGTGD